MPGHGSIDLLTELRSKAFSFGRIDKNLGNAITSTVDFVMTAVRDGDDEESLMDAAQSLSSTRTLAMTRDTNRSDPLRSLVYGLSESIGCISEAIVEERKRGEAIGLGDDVAEAVGDMLGTLRRKLIEELRVKAFTLGSADRPMSNVLTAVFDLILTVLRDGIGNEDEYLSDAVESLAATRAIAQRRDANRHDPLRELVYGLTEATASMVQSMAGENKGWSNESSDAAVPSVQYPLVIKEEPQDDGFNSADMVLPVFPHDDQPCSSRQVQLFSDADDDEDDKSGLRHLLQAHSSTLEVIKAGGSSDGAMADGDYEEHEWNGHFDDSQDDSQDGDEEYQPLSYVQRRMRQNMDEEATTSTGSRRSKRSITSSLRFKEAELSLGTASMSRTPKWELKGAPSSFAATKQSFPCNQCSKRFKSMRALTSHAYRHKGDVIRCACNQFLRKENWTRHTKLCHLSANTKSAGVVPKAVSKKAEPRWAQPQAVPRLTDGTFASDNMAVDWAMPILTPKVVPPKVDIVVPKVLEYKKNFLKKAAARKRARENKTCEICGKVLHNKSHLDYHMRQHTGENPYPCPYCNLQLRAASTRNMHIRRVHGLQPYQCSTCGLQFERHLEMQAHLQKKKGHVQLGKEQQQDLSEGEEEF